MTGTSQFILLHAASLVAQLAGDAVDFANQTNIHPIGLLVLVIMSLLALTLGRTQATVPLLIMAAFVPAGQRITILTLDFSFIRLLAIVYFLRILARNEFKGFRFVALDYAIIAWVTAGTLAYTALHGSVSALVFKLGFGYETITIYFTFRILLRSRDDIVLVLKALAVLAIPVSVLLVIEQTTGRNLFSTMGGVPPETLIRDGRRRAQGAFSHPIMAGCFWATALALLGGLFLSRKKRSTAFAGSFCSLVIILACSSSTPVFSIMTAGMAMVFGKFRSLVKPIVVGTPFVLLALHMVMQQPVWHLISRVSAVGGSTGWHRYHLIDRAIANFPEWALIGTRGTAHWGWGLRDVTNQYVLEGVRGGFITLAIFVLVLVLSFRSIGIALMNFPRAKGDFWIVWGIGAAMLAHVASFMAVSYFGQILVIFYLSLALCANARSVFSHAPAAARRSMRRPNFYYEQEAIASQQPPRAQARPNPEPNT